MKQSAKFVSKTEKDRMTELWRIITAHYNNGISGCTTRIWGACYWRWKVA
jgi:hypothetical protein